MKRRDFLKAAGIGAAGLFAAPYILPSGSLFARTGSQKVGHVVWAMLAGGVRNIESVEKAEGNLMPGILRGDERISGDISHSFAPTPDARALPHMGAPLQDKGTLFTRVNYSAGETGHYQGHVTAITGNYTDNSLNLRGRPQYPTVFEYFRKHAEDRDSPLSAWWVAFSLGSYPLLNYSDHPGYGPLYAANHVTPSSFYNPDVAAVLTDTITLMHPEEAAVNNMRNFLNNNYRNPDAQRALGLRNTGEDLERLQAFNTRMMDESRSGRYWDRWGVGQAYNVDMLTTAYAEEILREFQPTLTVVNMQQVDICHNNFTSYCDNLKRADYAVAHLWSTIQSIPQMADNTVLIVSPEIGRNAEPNSLIDQNGRYALDHTGDEMARRFFCLIAGPGGVVNQGQVVADVNVAEAIDIVPTIAYLLGFDNALPAGLAPGKPLMQAFV